MAQVLLANGFKKVGALKGGWDAWTAVNGQVELKTAAAAATTTAPATSTTTPSPNTKNTAEPSAPSANVTKKKPNSRARKNGRKQNSIDANQPRPIS